MAVVVIRPAPLRYEPSLLNSTEAFGKPRFTQLKRLNASRRSCTRGAVDQVVAWLERLLTWMFVVASLACQATLLVGDDVVPLELGAAYRPVVACLWPLSLSLFALAVSSIGRLSALVVDRPGLSAMAAGVELGMFWALGAVLASRYGAVGMAVAALGGTIGYATEIACVSIRCSGAR